MLLSFSNIRPAIVDSLVLLSNVKNVELWHLQVLTFSKISFMIHIIATSLAGKSHLKYFILLFYVCSFLWYSLAILPNSVLFFRVQLSLILTKICNIIVIILRHPKELPRKVYWNSGAPCKLVDSKCFGLVGTCWRSLTGTLLIDLLLI